MKKALLLFCMVITLVASSAFAQEVRGCSTRRVVYEGKEYTQRWSSETSNKYYGWEIKNNNSIKISVDITLYSQGGVYTNGSTAVQEGKHTVKTQSIILKPGESYIFKREEHCSTKVDYDCDFPISSYFIEYKAYKLQ